jgi:hypothetical protein
MNYTFGRAMDEHNVLFITDTSGGATGAGGWQDADCRRCDRGLSITHQKHNFKFNYTYDLPFGAGKRFANDMHPVADAVLGGWQVNGIGTFTSGRPFDVNLGFGFDRANTLRTGNFLATRPNWRTGYDGDPTAKGTSVGCPGIAPGTPIGGPDRYYDPCAFELQPAGLFGNVPRNSLIGPGLANFDLGMTKNVNVRNRANLQVRIEVFNLFNRPNFAIPALSVGTAVITSAAGTISPTAGRILSTATTSRQVQFGLKLLF